MRALALCMALLTAACAAPRFDHIGADDPQSPFYAEFCALSQIKKRPGFGADIRGEIGGHSVFYLQGACIDPAIDYPVLIPCEHDGVGLSVNEHFKTAKWVPMPGHDFFFQGDVPPGTRVTRATYQAVKRQAQLLGIYKHVGFHDIVFDNMPKGWTREDWKYEMSIGTDYAIDLARGRFCARVPVDRAAMRRMIDFLNAENAPYRAGAVFRWNLFNDNCIHLAHNALAAAGVWDVWRTHRPLIVSMFDFPVPRNDFVNLERQTNDTIPKNPAAAFDDPTARHALLTYGLLPARPGALALSRPVAEPNDVYETDELQMIFYDDPLFGPYQRRFDQIFAESRYTDPAANRAYFAAFARQALADRQPLEAWLAHPRYAAQTSAFTAIYDRYYALMRTWTASGIGAPPSKAILSAKETM